MEWKRDLYNPAMQERARQLRGEATEAEDALWQLLRRRRCGGSRFIRQVAVGRFILDFYCPAVRLAIEVDGGIHDTPEVRDRDRERDGVLLEEMAIRTMRLSNEEILSGSAEALRQRILHAVLQAEQAVPPFGERPARRR